MKMKIDKEQQLKEIKSEHIRWVDESISKFYWDFADDLGDESGERMNNLLNGEFRAKMLEILMDDWKSYGA